VEARGELGLGGEGEGNYRLRRWHLALEGYGDWGGGIIDVGGGGGVTGGVAGCVAGGG